MKKFTAVVSVLAALSLGNAAWAHPAHDDMPAVAPKLELSKSANGPLLSVVAGEKMLSTNGATGVLKVVQGTKTQEIALRPVGINGMEPKSPAKIDAGAKARASVTLADKTVVTAEFVTQ